MLAEENPLRRKLPDKTHTIDLSVPAIEVREEEMQLSSNNPTKFNLNSGYTCRSEMRASFLCAFTYLQFFKFFSDSG
jgi:hypothetical protein